MTMAVFKGDWLSPAGVPFDKAAVPQLVTERSRSARQDRHARTTLSIRRQGGQPTIRIVRDAWAALSDTERAAWKSGTVEMASNRNNTTNNVRNAWIYFCRANFASAWYVGLADRLWNELPSWTIVDLAITDADWAHGEFTFGYKAQASPGAPRQPRLFVYLNNPGRKAPPSSYRNTRLVALNNGPFVDGDSYSHRISSPWYFMVGDACTIITRLATDAGYGLTKYTHIVYPPP